MKQKEQEQTDMELQKTPENSKEFLRREPLGKLLVKLALPTVAAQLINMLYNIVDGSISGIFRISEPPP